MCRFRSVLVLWLLATTLTGCAGYRFIRADEVTLPSYEPREIPIPATCDALLQRAGTTGATRLSEVEARELTFCQLQYVLRAQEEEAAARRGRVVRAAGRAGRDHRPDRRARLGLLNARLLAMCPFSRAARSGGSGARRSRR
jgi:hypothetical protein